MNKILLIGAGGHAKSIADTIQNNGGLELLGYLDNNPSLSHGPMHLPIFGRINSLKDHEHTGIEYTFLAIGAFGNFHLREQLVAMVHETNFRFPVVSDHRAIVSPDVTIGEGTFVGKRAVINAGTTIGKHVIINTGAIIEHDCAIGDFAHISPGVMIGGHSVIGENCHIGIGSTIVPGVRIGNMSLIHPGSVVTHDIPDFAVAMGSPCEVVALRDDLNV